MKIGLAYEVDDGKYSVNLDRQAVELLMDKHEKEMIAAAQGHRYPDLRTALDAWENLNTLLHPAKETTE